MKLFKSNKIQNYTDEELLSLLSQTDKMEYLQQLYERHIPLIYGLCLKYLQNADNAQDAVMDIYESLHQKISKYEIQNFKNWLYSVVKFHCFAVLKENKKEIIVNFDSQIVESDDSLYLFDEELENEKETILRTCIEKLPEPQKIAILKFFYEEKSYADIVCETGYNLKSVKSYIQNGKRNLKICMEKSLEQ